MIGKRVQSFCSEDISLIENYEEAIDSSLMYECHHRKEEEGYTKKDLIEMNLYFQRPAEELIFLKEADHKSMHSKGRIISEEIKEKIRTTLKGKPLTEERKAKISAAMIGKHWNLSDETKAKMSAAQKGKLAGKHWYKDEKIGKRIWY